MLADNCLCEDKARPSLFAELARTMQISLEPGPALDDFMSTFSQSWPCALDQYLAAHGSCVDLSRWIKGSVMISITDALYGPFNPFREQRVRDAYWLVDVVKVVLADPSADTEQDLLLSAPAHVHAARCYTEAIRAEGPCSTRSAHQGLY